MGQGDFFSSGASVNVVEPAASAPSVAGDATPHERAVTSSTTHLALVSEGVNTVEKHKKQAFTSIIHGKVKHEETWPPFPSPEPSLGGSRPDRKAQMVCD